MANKGGVYEETGHTVSGLIPPISCLSVILFHPAEVPENSQHTRIIFPPPARGFLLSHYTKMIARSKN